MKQNSGEDKQSTFTALAKKLANLEFKNFMEILNLWWQNLTEVDKATLSRLSHERPGVILPEMREITSTALGLSAAAESLNCL